MCKKSCLHTISKNLLLYNEVKIILGEQSLSTVDRAFTLHMAELDSIPGTLWSTEPSRAQ